MEESYRDATPAILTLIVPTLQSLCLQQLLNVAILLLVEHMHMPLPVRLC